MMGLLEMVSEEAYKGFFVDLYVRCANVVAIELYEKLGYSVYRRVREYYGSLGVGKGGKDEEDAFGQRSAFLFCGLQLINNLDMRKPLPRDAARRSVRPNGRDIIVSRQDVS